MISWWISRRYLEGDTRGDEKKDKSEEEENLEPVGREPDIPNLVWNKISTRHTKPEHNQLSFHSFLSLAAGLGLYVQQNQSNIINARFGIWCLASEMCPNDVQGTKS